MTGEGELVHVFLRDAFALFVVLVHQACADIKARRIPCGSDVIHNRFVGFQGDASPIGTDVGKQLMFDRIPLR